MARRESTATTTTTTEPARLRLRAAAGAPDRFVDGGWWPHSLDFTAELPELIKELDESAYPKVWAVTYNLDVWDRPPHFIRADGRRVRMGGFHRPANRAMVSLVDGSGWSHIDLVVVPPNTAPDVAERALTLAADDGDHNRADEIMALAAE